MIKTTTYAEELHIGEILERTEDTLMQAIKRNGKIGARPYEMEEFDEAMTSALYDLLRRTQGLKNTFYARNPALIADVPYEIETEEMELGGFAEA